MIARIGADDRSENARCRRAMTRVAETSGRQATGRGVPQERYQSMVTKGRAFLKGERLSTRCEQPARAQLALSQ